MMTVEPKSLVIDVLAEATRIVAETVHSTLKGTADSAAVCGCRGCRAQAVQTTEWATRLFEVEGQLD
jgi:hypothetical protein